MSDATAKVEMSKVDIEIITSLLLHLPQERLMQMSPEIGVRLYGAITEIGQKSQAEPDEQTDPSFSNGERWVELCRQIDAGEIPLCVFEDAKHMGAATLEMHIDCALEHRVKA